MTNLSIRCEEVRVNIVDSSIGNISISDVERAYAVKTFTLSNNMATRSNSTGTSKTLAAMILGFNVNITNQGTKTKIKDCGVSVIRDTVIYRYIVFICVMLSRFLYI